MTSLSEALLGNIVPSPLLSTAARLLKLHEADRVYRQLRRSESDLLSGLLAHLSVKYNVAREDLAHVPKTGPAVVVANHPFGILEAAVLFTALREIRSDIRILANDVVSAIPQLRDVVIPIDVLNPQPGRNAAAVRRALKFARQGGLLIVFPAGAVSHFQWRERRSSDPPWNAEIARLVRISGATVTPVYIPGSNSFTFHAAGCVDPRLRTALLARELFDKRATTVELRIGHSISPAKLLSLTTDTDRIEYLRWRTYLLANRQTFAANTRRPLASIRKGKERPIVEPVARDLLISEVNGLPVNCHLERSGELRVLFASASQIPNILREIGRLREITFRNAGEGTGQETDIDAFDAHYLHLFVWNSAKQEIVGAYRLRPAGRPEELYTRTLFQYDETFLNALGPAMELGRSFIRAEYQKSFAPLLLLWKGIGKVVAANPECKTLFGPVSISNEYQSISRELMIAFLEKRASLTELAKLVRPRRRVPMPRIEGRCQDVQELSEVIGDLEPSQPGIPVLLRQYLKLGGKLLGFNVDPEFSHVLDGLIVVDLTKTEPKLLERYLGKQEARSFLNFHKEIVHGTQ